MESELTNSESTLVGFEGGCGMMSPTGRSLGCARMRSVSRHSWSLLLIMLWHRLGCGFVIYRNCALDP